MLACLFLLFIYLFFAVSFLYQIKALCVAGMSVNKVKMKAVTILGEPTNNNFSLLGVEFQQ